MTPDDVLGFWFGADERGRELRTRQWFAADPAFDAEIRERFGAELDAAARGERDDWAVTPRGALALVILLDQLSRNMFRGTARAFAQDERARALVHRGLADEIDQRLEPLEAAFFYMPLEHSEALADQDAAVERFSQLLARTPPPLRQRIAGFLDYAERHRRIIQRFGRFPHRNALLGRPSTTEELDFLKQPGSSF